MVWFGARSFWGHMRHFIASAIATEDVDSRDWMSANPPAQLCARVVEQLGGTTGARSVTEGLGSELWLDYVADTGDDVSVSRAVAGLVFRDYQLPDPAQPGAELHAPRGDVLLFGGDTAYPVATCRGYFSRPLSSSRPQASAATSAGSARPAGRPRSRPRGGRRSSRALPSVASSVSPCRRNCSTRTERAVAGAPVRLERATRSGVAGRTLMLPTRC